MTPPDAAAPPARPWTPAPVPTARDLLADDLRHHVGQLGRAGSTLARPVTTARRAQEAWRAMREMSAAEPAPATSLNRIVGAGRPLADQARGNLIGQFVVPLPVAVPDPASAEDELRALAASA